jgi:uncharacterized membrane protein (TIGR01218 family)
MRINLSKEEINKRLLDKELSKKHKQKAKTNTSLSGMTPLLVPAATPIIELFNIKLPSFINLIIVLLSFILILRLHIQKSKQAKKLLRMIGQENLSQERILIFPSSVFQILKILFIFIFSIGLTLVFNTHFLWYDDQSNGPLLVMGAVFFMGVINMNTVLMRAGKYKIKILDQ